MAEIIEDYVDLMMQAADESGHYDFAPMFNSMVLATENKINRILRAGDQQVHDTLTFTDGVATLPTDFLEMLTIGRQMYAPLKATTLEAINLYYQSGNPVWYSINGDEIITGPGYTGDLDIIYYRGVTALETTGTNWLLQKSPDAYLFGVVERIAMWKRDAKTVEIAAQIMATSVGSFSHQDKMRRFANTRVRIGGMTP